MDLVLLLAQAEPGPAVRGAKRALERLFELYPPEIAVPACIVGLVVLAWLVERILIVFVRRMTARTKTKVDDALVSGLPTIMRPLVALVALHVVVQQLMRSDADASRLSAEGEIAARALMVVSIVVLAVAVTLVASRLIDAWVADREERHAVGPPLKLAVKVAMVPVALIAVLQAVEVPIASFVTALGIGSLAVGLALQDTLKNLFAGILIVLDRPIRAGDFIELDRAVRGTVLEIGLRSTKLRSVDNNVIIIPNATIANAVVVNFDVEDKRFVQAFQISVAYGSDTRRVQAVLEEVAAAAQKDLPALAEDPPSASLRDFGESGINFGVTMTFRDWAGRLPLVGEMYHRFYDRLRAEGIEIPFPTRTVHVRNESAIATTIAAPSSRPSR